LRVPEPAWSIAMDQITARIDAADRFEFQTLCVALADIGHQFHSHFGLVAENNQCPFAQNKCGFEGLADLIVDPGLDQFDGMLAIDRACQNWHQWKLVPGEFGDSAGRLRVVDCNDDRFRVFRSCCMKDVEARSVTIIDLEAEILCIPDRLGARLDDRNRMSAGQKGLTDDLAEAPET